MAKAANQEIVVTREFDAPRELVFAACTKREHIENWWLPSGSTTQEISVKPGGIWRYSQPSRDGTLIPYMVKFVEIDKPSRLVYEWGVDMENAPPVRTNLTFDEENGKTKVTLQLLFANAAEKEKAVKYGAIVGAMTALENLADYVATL